MTEIFPFGTEKTVVSVFDQYAIYADFNQLLEFMDFCSMLCFHHLPESENCFFHVRCALSITVMVIF